MQSRRVVASSVGGGSASGSKGGSSRLLTMRSLLCLVVLVTLAMLAMSSRGYHYHGSSDGNVVSRFPSSHNAGDKKETTVRDSAEEVTTSPPLVARGKAAAVGAGQNHNIEAETELQQKQQGHRDAIAITSSDSNPASTSSSCPTDRFLYIGNTFGRHNNQLMSLMTAVIVARRLHRTLVIPPFSDGSASSNKKGTAAKFEIDQFYDISDLVKNECVILERDWMAQISGQKESTAVHAVKAACITMRGIQTHPQHPVGGKFECETSHFVKFKKRAPLFYSVATTAEAADARVLTVPLVIYLAEAMTAMEASQPWRWLRPHGTILQIARGIVNGIRNNGATEGTTGDDKNTAGHASSYSSSTTTSLSSAVCAVHFRSLEGSCAKRVGEFVKQSEQPKKFAAITQQCEMTSKYIAANVDRFFQKTKTVFQRKGLWSVVIADDGQQPGKVSAMAQAVPKSGAAVRMSTMVDLRTREVPAPLNPITAVIQQVGQQQPQPPQWDKIKGSGKPFFSESELAAVTTRFGKNIPMFRLLVDFWVLVEADVFVGNQLSTLSMNVCKARLSRGRGCDNFVLEDEKKKEK